MSTKITFSTSTQYSYDDLQKKYNNFMVPAFEVKVGGHEHPEGEQLHLPAGDHYSGHGRKRGALHRDERVQLYDLRNIRHENLLLQFGRAGQAENRRQGGGGRRVRLFACRAVCRPAQSRAGVVRRRGRDHPGLGVRLHHSPAQRQKVCPL